MIPRLKKKRSLCSLVTDTHSVSTTETTAQRTREIRWNLTVMLQLIQLTFSRRSPPQELTLCRCFSPDVNSKGASPPEGTSFHSDILPEPAPGIPGSACPVFAKITFDRVVVTVLNHKVHPAI